MIQKFLMLDSPLFLLYSRYLSLMHLSLRNQSPSSVKTVPATLAVTPLSPHGKQQNSETLSLQMKLQLRASRVPGQTPTPRQLRLMAGRQELITIYEFIRRLRRGIAGCGVIVNIKFR